MDIKNKNKTKTLNKYIQVHDKVKNILIIDTIMLFICQTRETSFIPQNKTQNGKEEKSINKHFMIIKLNDLIFVLNGFFLSFVYIFFTNACIYFEKLK